MTSHVRSSWSEPSCIILDPLLEGPLPPMNLQKWLASCEKSPSIHSSKVVAGMIGRRKWRTWIQFCKLTCVNRSWRKALLEWSAMQNCLAIEAPETSSLFSTLRLFRRLRYLSITRGDLEDELLRALPELADSLESVALGSRNSEELDITDALLLRMAHLCKGLREIKLENAEGITSVGITALAAACPLTDVSLECCTGVSVEGVRALTILRPTLHALTLNAEDDVMGGWMLDMTAVASSVAMLAHLQHLNLSGTLCGDNDLDLIAGGCKQLSELILRDCPLLVLASFADAPSPCLQQLTVLNLSDSTGLNDDGARAIARLSSRPGALLLQNTESRVELSGCTCLTSMALRAFSDGPPKMGYLHLPDVDEDVLACALGMNPSCTSERSSGSSFLMTISDEQMSSCRFTQDGSALYLEWTRGASTPKINEKLKHEYVHLLPEADRAWHYEPAPALPSQNF